MLQFFRNMFKSKFGTLFAFAVLAVIALAFASGDITSSGAFGGAGGAGGRVATIGKDKIEASALSQAATTALENIKQQDPTQSMQGFIAVGGIERVLNEMIDRTAVAVFGAQHGVIASERLIDSEIASMPAFQGPDGKFSEPLYRSLLQQRGVSEELIRRDIAQGLVARQLLVPAGYGATFPREAAIRYAALLREKRVGVIALLPSAAFAPAAPPTDAELTAFYNAKRTAFIRPERRVIRYATFGDAALKAIPAPTDAQIAALYNADKAQYAGLETRELTQLVVPTEAAARAVAAEVAKGQSLEAAASAKGLSAAKLNAISKQALTTQASQAVADAAFAAAKGALTAPARSGLGWHIIRVDAVTLRPERTLAEVRDELAAKVAEVNRRKALNDLSAQIEEQFNDGASLSDVAKQHALTLQTVGPVTADGGIYGKPGETAPAILARALPTAFAMEEGKPQLAEVEAGKTFAIFDVSNIAASAPAPLAEIKQDVTAAYMLDKGAAAAKAAAEKVAAETRKGGDLAAGLAALKRPNIGVQQVAMDRTQLTAGGRQPAPPLMLLFSMAAGSTKVLPAPNNQGSFIVTLKTIEPGAAPANDPVIAGAQRELGQLTGQEYVQQLSRAIQTDVGVKRNAAAIAAVKKQLTGE